VGLDPGAIGSPPATPAWQPATTHPATASSSLLPGARLTRVA